MKSLLKSKIISAVAAAAMVMTYAVPFAQAADTTVKLFGDGFVHLMADPDLTLELTSVSETTTWTFDTIAGTYEESTAVLDSTLGIYAASGKAVTVDTSNKTIDNVKYTSRLKLGGSGNISGTPTRVVEIVPSKAGTVYVAFAHGSSSGDARTMAIWQDGSVIATQSVDADSNTSVTATVEGGKPVLIYSQSSGLNIYGITYTADADAPIITEAPATTAPVITEVPATTAPAITEEPATEAPATTAPAETEVPATTAPAETEAPATDVPTTDAPADTDEPEATEEPTPEPLDLTTLDVTGVSADTTWTFDDLSGTTYSEPTAVFDSTLGIYGGDGAAVTVDGSNKTIDGTKYTTRLKFGGAGSLAGVPTRVLKIVPEKTGKIYIAFAHASSSGDDRTMAVWQNDAVLGTATVAANEYTAFETVVAAGSPVLIYSQTSGLNIYAIKYTVDESATTAPTLEPTEVPTTTDAPSDTDAPTTTDAPTITDVPSETDAPTETPTTAPTEEPSQALFWKASVDVTAGTELSPVTGLTPLCDMTYKDSSQTIAGEDFAGRISGTDTPAFESDVPVSGTVLKYEATEDGTLTVYYKLGASKVFYITDYLGQTLANNENVEESSVYAATSYAVEAGGTYYAYIKGSKAEFFGASFEASATAPTEAPATTAPADTDAPTITDEPSATEEPTPEPLDLTTLDVAGVSTDTTWTFDDLSDTTYTEPTALFDSTLGVYGGESAAITIDGSNKTIDGTKYTTRLKLGGAGSLEGVPTRVLKIVPEKTGKIYIAFAHASSSGDDRTMAVWQNDAVLGSATVAAGENTAFETVVAAGSPVLIYSQNSGLNIYAITYTVDESATTAPVITAAPTTAPTEAPSVTDTPSDPDVTAEPTAEPLDLTTLEVAGVSTDTTWTFDDLSDTTYTEPTAVLDSTLGIYGGESATITIDGSNKTIDGTKYTTRLKLGGAGSLEGVPTRVLKIVPEKTGKIYIAFAHASSSGDDRTMAVWQNDAVLGSATVAAGENTAFETVVAAGSPVLIYSQNSGLNIYAITYTVDESATTAPVITAAPTTAPTDVPSVTDTPSDPSVTNTPGLDLSTLVIDAVSADKTWTFDDVAGSYTDNTALFSDFGIYATEGSGITIDTSNKTIDGTKYTSRLKLGGAASLDGVPVRAIKILPEKAGRVYAAFAHASSSGDARTMVIYQDGEIKATASVEAGETGYVEAVVSAGSPVLIYSQNSGLNVYGVTYTVDESATPVPTAAPTATTDPSATVDPSATTAPTATAVPESSLAKAQADADALELITLNEYAIYIDIVLANEGENGSTVTWTSSNEDYIKVAQVSQNETTYTGMVTRPSSDDPNLVDGGVPVTLTATVTNGDAVVTRDFEVSVREANPLYFNDFQADIRAVMDGESNEGTDYRDIEENNESVTGETFKGIRFNAFKYSRAFGDEWSHDDIDTEQYFDKRIMSLQDIDANERSYSLRDGEEDYGYYISEHTSYGGSTTYITQWITLTDPETDTYPEGIVVINYDIYFMPDETDGKVKSQQQLYSGIGTDKPAQMCRFELNKGNLRAYNNEAYYYPDGNTKYSVPQNKWVRCTIVANSNTHLWDFYFDGALIGENLNFRNAQDYIPTIEITLARSGYGDAYIFDNFYVENITDDYNEMYMDYTFTLVNCPTDEDGNYVASNGDFLLNYEGTGAMSGSYFTWKSSDSSVLAVSQELISVDDLAQYGYTEDQINTYKTAGVETVAVNVAKPSTTLTEDKTVTLTAILDMGGTVLTREFTVTVPAASSSSGDADTDSAKALADLNAITSVTSGSTLTGSQTLSLESIGSIYGSSITWRTSNSSYITSGGSVTAPSSGTATVTLTAVATYGDAVETKDFKITVKSSSSSPSGGGGGGGGSSSSSSSGSSSSSSGVFIPVGDTTTTAESQSEISAAKDQYKSDTSFTDLDSVSWAEDAILELYKRGVVDGYGDGTFGPNDAVTREQFVKMLVTALDLSVTDNLKTPTFDDVDSSAWYADYINTAYSLGIVNGIDESTFGVGVNISRQDMAVMISRAAAIKGINLDTTATASFADSSDISDYAVSAVGAMNNAGYIMGDDTGRFNPLDTATRAQVCVVLDRIIGG